MDISTIAPDFSCIFCGGEKMFKKTITQAGYGIEKLDSQPVSIKTMDTGQDIHI